MIARVVAQAKVNLTLRVLARQPDGYHALETVFHQLELSDEVTVERTLGERALACSGPALPPGGLGPASQNLAWQAADAYARAAGWSGGFSIELVKRIPAGGGLGGGSSDAGAVLRACERLSEMPLGEARVQELAAALGSDVPFLAGEHAAAIGRGRGDRLEPLAPLPQREVALIFPSFGVSTKDAYSWLASSRSGAEPRADAAAPDVAGWAEAAAAAENDFETVVAARHPAIGRYVDALRDAGAGLARMSGSGSTVFGVFTSEAAAHARAALREQIGDAHVVWTRTAERVVPVEVSG